MVWIFIRDGQTRKVFADRKEAVTYFKEMLTQTLKDFKNQDKNDNFTYNIHLPEMSFIFVEERDVDMSLL